MSLFTKVIEMFIFKLPSVLASVSEVDIEKLDGSATAGNEVALAQVGFEDPLYVKGLVIMILVSAIILVCMKISRIDLSYARSN